MLILNSTKLTRLTITDKNNAKQSYSQDSRTKQDRDHMSAATCGSTHGRKDLLQVTYTHKLTHNPRTVTPKTPKLNNLILHCSDQNPMTTLLKATKSDQQRSIIHG